MPSPTILQILPSLVAGGAERGCLDVAAAIVQAGGKALVVSSGGPMVHELQRSGAKHIQMNAASKNPFTMRANAAKLAKIITRERVDIIHARSRAPAWSAYWAAKRTRTPFVTTFHAAYKFKSKVKRRYNAVMAKADRIIAISHFIADHVQKIYGVAEDRIKIIPRGIDLAKFNRGVVTSERLIKLSASWRVPDDLPILLMPARLSRIKGHSVLIEALALRQKRDLYCVIVGATSAKDPYRRELEALIEARNLSGFVRIVDHCSDMATAYYLSACVVAPSIVPEGFGRVPVEAQAMGRPIIATDLGGFRETIVDGGTGLLVPPGDAHALAQAIDSVMALAPDDRDALGRAAEDYINRHFSKETMCAETLAVYQELLNANVFGLMQKGKAA